MTKIEEVIDTLSDEELDLLNNDPEMLAAFKAKYAEPESAIQVPPPQEALQSLAPSNIGKQAGMAAVNAPGVMSAAVNAIPGMGNPAAIPGAVQNIQQNPGQVKKAFQRGMAVSQGQPMTPQEKIPGYGGMAAGMALEAYTSPPIKQAASAIKNVVGNKIKDTVKTFKAPGLEESKLLAKDMMMKEAPKAAQKAQQAAAEAAQQIQDRIAKIKTTLQEIPGQYSKKEAALEGMKRAAGKEMGKAETDLGIEFKGNQRFEEIVKDPRRVSQIAEIMQGWSKETPEALASKYSPMGLQFFRKVAQEGSRTVSGLSNASLQVGRQKAVETLEHLFPTFKNARSTYLEITDALEALPAEMAGKKAAFRSEIIKSQNELKQMAVDAKKLLADAKNADAKDMVELKKKALELQQLGLKHDEMINKIKNSIIGAGTATAAITALQRLGGK